MPSSDPTRINEVLDLIIVSQAKSVLDIGPGFGKFGFLAREYLDVTDGREKVDDWQRRIDAVEAFEGYVTPLLKAIYNKIYVGDAVKVVPKLKQKYDLILMVDVIEHLTEVQGKRLLESCRNIGRSMIIVTPKDIGVQDDAFGNEYERHRFQWRKEHFEAYGPHFFVSNPNYFIVYIGPDAQRAKHASRSHYKTKRWVRDNVPFLKAPYRAAQRVTGKKK